MKHSLVLVCLIFLIACTSACQPAASTASGDVPKVKLRAQMGKGAVNQVAWAPDGKRFAVASSLGIYLLDATTLTEVRFIENDRPIFSLAFNGQLLAGGSDTEGYLWNADTGKLLMQTKKPVSTWNNTLVALSADGKTLAVGARGLSDSRIDVFDTNTGATIAIIYASYMNSFALSHDGQTIAAVTDDVQLWDTYTGHLRREIEIHKDMDQVAFSADGKSIAVGGYRFLQVWDVDNGKLLSSLETHVEPSYYLESVETISFSPDGRTLAASGRYENNIWLWHVDTGQFKQLLPGHIDWIKSVAFSPDGRTLLSGSADGSVRLWNSKTGRQENKINYSGEITSLAFSPEGSTLMSGGSDGVVRWWDSHSGRQLHTFDVETVVTGVAFAPDGCTFAAGSDAIHLWDADSTQLIHKIDTFFHVHSVAYSSANGNLVSAVSNYVEVWDTSTAHRLKSIPINVQYVQHISTSPNGQWFAAVGPDIHGIKISIGDFQQGVIKELGGHEGFVNATAFSPDSKMLASASDDGTARLWDIETGKLLKTLGASQLGSEHGVSSVTFSPDGHMVATAGWDRTVNLWDITTGQLELTLDDHVGSVRSIAFSPDGRLFASAGEDGTIRLWEVEP